MEAAVHFLFCFFSLIQTESDLYRFKPQSGVRITPSRMGEDRIQIGRGLRRCPTIKVIEKNVPTDKDTIA